MRVSSTIGIWICITASVAFGQRATAAADEIFYNGKIITVDSAFRIEQAFAVIGEEFIAVGSNAGVRALAGPKTRLTDLRGHAVIPGMMDNHNHQYITAQRLYRGVDLAGVASIPELLSRLQQAAARAKPGETVFTTANWSEMDLAEKRAPTRQELDRASLDHPIVLYRSRLNASFNSAALKAAGIGRDTQLAGGNPVPKDAAGEPTGAVDSASVIDRIVPPPSEREQEELILKVQEQQNALGLTSIRELNLRPEAMRAYWRLWRQGKLTMRVSMGIDVDADEAGKLDEILKNWGVGPGFGDHSLRLDGVAELALDNRTKPYLRHSPLDLPSYNIPAQRITPKQLTQAMLTINLYGWRPAIHIYGDKYLDLALDSFEAANAQSSIRGKRWIVEHVPLANVDQMDRMARLGVLISAQAQPYSHYEENLRSWGKENTQRAVPMRQWLDHHLMVSSGSDWLGYPNNPFCNLYFYVSRKTEHGAVVGASEKISREEALRLATINNAYLTFEEKAKGSIEPGKLADFVILSQDFLTVPEEAILSIKPLATYVGGRKIFAANVDSF